MSMLKKFLFLFGLLIVLISCSIKYTNVDPYKMLSGVFFIDSLTTEQLKSKDTVKILVVPGHDNEYWGTQYKGVKEAELNLELAKYLTLYLRQEKDFQVFLIRDEEGYDAGYLDYLDDHEEEIFEFQERHKEIMRSLSEVGLVDAHVNYLLGSKALSDIANRLYGINKWSNDAGIDIVIHIHFNDYRGRKSWSVGKYSGLTVYVPDKQYSNSKVSRSVAESISASLGKFFSYSDLPMEKSEDGIKESQDFIAPGAFNTLDAAGMLIEYGYVYEPQFTNSNTREAVLKKMAVQTYLGVLDFFDKEPKREIVSLSHGWENDLKKGLNNNRDVIALQFLLASKGFYPPTGLSLNQCPTSGSFGNCTLSAVKSFQKNYDIVPASGFVGPLTRSKLNDFK